VRACARQPLTAIFEPDVPAQMVVAAPYNLVRHPFYLAYSLFWVAGWVGTATWTSAAVAALMIRTYVIAARNEEAKFAASPLAAAYRRYQRETGFFLPKLTLRLTETAVSNETLARLSQRPTT
jgi:protein-S-isoprenylcysteine O-methyltransferase Ste14